MGGIQKHELSYAGATWSLNNLNAEKGLDLLSRISAILGGPLGELMSAILTGGKPMAQLVAADLPKEAIAKVLGTLVQQLHAGGAKDIVKELLAGLYKDQKPVDFNQYFAGNYSELFRLVGWALEINYRDFLGGLNLGDQLNGPGMLASLFRQPISPGSSGAS